MPLFFSCKNTHKKSDADQSAAFPGELSLKGSLTCDSIISHVVKKAMPTNASLFPVIPHMKAVNRSVLYHEHGNAARDFVSFSLYVS